MVKKISLLLMFISAVSLFGQERKVQDWANFNRYKEENAKLGKPVSGENRVVFMGNSITDAWVSERPELYRSANKWLSCKNYKCRLGNWR